MTTPSSGCQNFWSRVTSTSSGRTWNNSSHFAEATSVRKFPAIGRRGLLVELPRTNILTDTAIFRPILPIFSLQKSLPDMFRPLLKIIVLSPLVLALCGCASDTIGMPNLFHPGHISEQQDRMKRFDPFTRSDIGPRIEGDRPAGSLNQTPTPQHLKEYGR